MRDRRRESQVTAKAGALIAAVRLKSGHGKKQQKIYSKRRPWFALSPVTQSPKPRLK